MFKVRTVDLGKELEDSVEWLSEDGGFWTTEGKVRGAGVFGLANVDPAADDREGRLGKEEADLPGDGVGDDVTPTGDVGVGMPGEEGAMCTGDEGRGA